MQKLGSDFRPFTRRRRHGLLVVCVLLLKVIQALSTAVGPEPTEIYHPELLALMPV